MENQKLNREDLSNQIFDLLIEDENFAIDLWKRHYQDLVLPTAKSPVLITILTVVYNCDEYIKNALESTLMQTYSNFELVIVADPCRDRTIEIINEYASLNEKINLIVNSERMGNIGSLNIGLNHCNGKYIARMDLDDLIHPMRIEKQFAFLENNPSISVVSAWMKSFDNNKKTNNFIYRQNFEEHKNTSLFFSPLSHAASMFKSEVLITLRYREGYIYAEDYDLWTRILQKFSTSALQEYLYLYRTHSNQVTNIRNIESTKESLRKIVTNIHELFQIEKKSETIEFHLKYFMFYEALNTKQEFIRWDIYLRSLLVGNNKSNYLIKDSFTNFIFKNYWQTNFSNHFSKLNKKEKFELFKSPFCKFSLIQKVKHFMED